MAEGDSMSVSVVDPTHPVDYKSTMVPPTYKCGKCGATNCKLWRDYQTFLKNQSLLCAKCAGEEQKKDVSDIDDEGRRSLEEGLGVRTDQIGWRIPAVPTEENDTYWGYTSVPQPGCDWWRGLPTHPQ